MSAAEEWRRIPGFPQYEVSNLGNVRSWRPYRGTALPRPMKVQLDATGYPSLRLWDGTRQVHRRVHRLLLTAFVGERPEGQVTRHLNGDPRDNRLDNLAYGTQFENAGDTAEHGRNYFSNVTHCPQGHEYDDRNTRWVRTRNRAPFRLCRTCEAVRDGARRAKRRAAA